LGRRQSVDQCGRRPSARRTPWPQASLIDAAIARGEDPGPLAGVPVTIKANIDQARICHH